MRQRESVEKLVSCSWCENLNAEGRKFCANCGHRADLPRVKCDCPKCAHFTVPYWSTMAAASAGSMTREKAIELLSDCCDRHVMTINQDLYEAVRMGKEALIAEGSVLIPPEGS